MKKRALSLLLALVMVFGLLPATAEASDFDSRLQYEIYEDHVEITGFSGYAAKIVIPNQIENLPVTTICDEAFLYHKLTSIELPDSITYIGMRAFDDCYNLISVDIPAGVTYIGERAFRNCYSLTGIHVDRNNSVYSSDDRGILFDKEVTQLIQAPGAITGSYTIPNSITSIGDAAFYYCTKLTDIDIPDGVTSIDEYAFPSCHSLTSISIPDGVTSIGEDTFSNCTDLTSVDLPNTLISIGKRAFFHCPKLTSIDIPDSVTSIDSQAFDMCKRLTSVDLPDGLTSIGSAFAGCSSLTSIDFPASVTSIDSHAFSNCTSVTSICFRGDAPSFGEYKVFYRVTATAYYPADNPTWTEDVRQNYGGKLTWVPYTPSPFTDVPPGSFFADPVAWAEENSITTGASEDSFNPGGECLRAQVVTFLHRAVENPEPASADISFTDVKSSDFFYTPVLWAVEKGITNGVSATAFGSYRVCNRAAVVTFLWRAAGEPEPESTDHPFTDVKSTDFYYKPVLWAVENGITNGLSATQFSPDSPCNRAQVVTFLYRAYN